MKWTAEKETGPGARHRSPGTAGPEWWVFERDAPEYQRLVAIVPGGPRAKSRALLIQALPQLLDALKAIEQGLAADNVESGDYWQARKLLDAAGVYNGNLSGTRVLLELARAALRSLEKARAVPRRR